MYDIVIWGGGKNYQMIDKVMYAQPFGRIVFSLGPTYFGFSSERKLTELLLFLSLNDDLYH